MTTTVERARLTVDLPAELRRRLRLAAALKDATVRDYVLGAIEERLNRDWSELTEREGLVALNGRADPVLAELWDNECDAAYDRL